MVTLLTMAAGDIKANTRLQVTSLHADRLSGNLEALHLIRPSIDAPFGSASASDETGLLRNHLWRSSCGFSLALGS